MDGIINILILVAIVAGIAGFLYVQHKNKGSVPSPDHLTAVTTAMSNAAASTASAVQAAVTAAFTPPPPQQPPVTVYAPQPVSPVPVQVTAPAPIAPQQIPLWPAGKVTVLPWDRMTTLEVPCGNTQIFAVDVPAGAIFTGYFAPTVSNNANWGVSYQTQLYANGSPFGPTQTMLAAGGTQKFADMGAPDYFPRCAPPCRVEFVVTCVGNPGGTYLMQFSQTNR
jgi:hypothetical protein